MWNFNSWVRKKYPWWGINSSFPLGKEVFSAINWPFCCTWPHWNEFFFEDCDISREFLITSLKKFTRNIKILSKPLIPIRPGTTQRSNKSGKNLFAHRKTFFYFPTKESSIPFWGEGHYALQVPHLYGRIMLLLLSRVHVALHIVSSVGISNTCEWCYLASFFLV